MVKFGNRVVGDGSPCFITFEAGATHDGLASAKHLVSLAARAGADAVKFQVFDAERTIADREQTFSYEVLVDRESEAMETVTESLYQIYKRRALTPDEWREVKRHSDECGVAFFATADSIDDVELLASLDCHSIKISSADVNHFPVIRAAARTGLCIQLDTGNATLGEVERAIDVVAAEGSENVIIHLCPSGYPASPENINLRIITTLKQMFGFPVAYSDHSPGWDMDVAAIALGANLIEKTITTDRTIRSPEHIMSLEPADQTRFIAAIRAVETALGRPRRRLRPEDVKRRRNIRRSVYVEADVKAGQRLGDVPVDFRMPGHGIQPERYEELVDARFNRDLPAGHRVAYSDLDIPDGAP